MSELSAINYILGVLFSLSFYSLAIYFRHRRKSRVREAMIQQAVKQYADQLEAQRAQIRAQFLDEYDRMMTLIAMVQTAHDIEEISLPDGTTYHVMRDSED